ncbi:MAG: putative O-glycosylation ligase, exosortase A system-associated [Gammaproteobacteria bacterium]
MRDILLTLIVFGFIPFILYRPYVGVLVWSWLGFMNPQRLCYGFAYDFPFSKLVAAITIIAFVYYKDKIIPKGSGLLWMLVIYTLWVSITTMTAIYPDDAMFEWTSFMKIMMGVGLILFMASDKNKVNALVAVIVLSLGYYGIKGGIFTVLTAGSYRVWGPAGSFIADNNALGLALVMTLPLMWYLYTQAQKKLYKNLAFAMMISTAFAVLGTQSRGGFLALMAMTAFLVMKSKAKFKVAAIVIIMAPLLYIFMPQSWHDRMDTIKNYEQDESAMMRINAWEYSINLANDHPIAGGGYSAFSQELFSVYSERPEIQWTGPHSIYFESLAEHGWVGLTFFILLLFSLYRAMSRIIKNASKYQDMLWMRDLAAMIQVSIVGYMVAGLFLEMAKFDLLYALIGIGIAMTTLLHKRQMLETEIPIQADGGVMPDMAMAMTSK